MTQQLADGGVVLRETVPSSDVVRARFGDVDGLRALAVVAIVAYQTVRFVGLPARVAPAIAQLLGDASQGFTLFLMLSAFSLAYPILAARRTDGATYLDVGRYAVKRLLRIYPAFIAVLAASFAAHPLAVAFHWTAVADAIPAVPVSSVLRSAVFLDDGGFGGLAYGAGNDGFTALALVARGFILLPVALFFWLRAPRVTLAAAILAAALDVLTPAHAFTLSAVLPLVLGIVAADLRVQHHRLQRFGLPLALAAALVAFFGEPFLETMAGTVAAPDALRVDPCWSIALFGLVAGVGFSGRLEAILGFPALRLLGSAAYGISLVAMPVAALATRTLPERFDFGALAASTAGEEFGAGIVVWLAIDRWFAGDLLRRRAADGPGAWLDRILAKVRASRIVFAAPAPPIVEEPVELRVAPPPPAFYAPPPRPATDIPVFSTRTGSADDLAAEILQTKARLGERSAAVLDPEPRPAAPALPPLPGSDPYAKPGFYRRPAQRATVGGGLATTALAPPIAVASIPAPAMAVPAISAPAISAPAIAEPAVAGPAVARPAIAEPATAERAIVAPAISTPAVAEPPAIPVSARVEAEKPSWDADVAADREEILVRDPALDARAAPFAAEPVAPAVAPAVAAPAVAAPAVAAPTVAAPTVAASAVAAPAAEAPTFTATAPAVTAPAVTAPAVTAPAATAPAAAAPAAKAWEAAAPNDHPSASAESTLEAPSETHVSAVDSTPGAPADRYAPAVDSALEAPADRYAPAVDSALEAPANRYAPAVDSALEAPAEPQPRAVDPTIASPTEVHVRAIASALGFPAGTHVHEPSETPAAVAAEFPNGMSSTPPDEPSASTPSDDPHPSAPSYDGESPLEMLRAAYPPLDERPPAPPAERNGSYLQGPSTATSAADAPAPLPVAPLPVAPSSDVFPAPEDAPGPAYRVPSLASSTDEAARAPKATAAPLLVTAPPEAIVTVERPAGAIFRPIVKASLLVRVFKHARAKFKPVADAVPAAASVLPIPNGPPAASLRNSVAANPGVTNAPATKPAAVSNAAAGTASAPHGLPPGGRPSIRMRIGPARVSRPDGDNG